MPLHKGKSKAVISRNIREMQAAGHPHRVAVAAAMREAHHANSHKSRHRRTHK